MDVSTNYLLSCFRLEELTVDTESSDDGGRSVVYSSQRDDADTQWELSYFFSNFAAKVVFDMMANGAAADSDVQNGLLFHSHGKPLHRINAVYPYTFDFLHETGNAGGPRITVSRFVRSARSFNLKPDFRDVIQKSYNPIFQNNVNFGDQTRLRFEVMLRFEAEWNEAFEDAGVQRFTLLDGRVVRTPFMTSKRKHYVRQFRNHKLLSIPFKQHQASRFSMLFYLPDRMEDYRELRVFVGLAESVIQDVYFPEEQVQVGNFLIPKFGMTVAGPLHFEPPFGFPHMTDHSSPGLITSYSSMVSNLQIDERGVRALGATAVALDQQSAEPSATSGEVAPTSRIQPLPRRDDGIDFVANRPFLFFIRDNKFGRMLYSGGLTLPFGASFEEDKEQRIKIGPWGGPGGDKWDYHPNQTIKRIIIRSGDFIDSVTFVREDGHSQRFGGFGGSRTHEVLLDTNPGEYLKAISGTFDLRALGATALMSLTFSTNIAEYGPFGVTGNQNFHAPIQYGTIVGFHGRAGMLVDAIGAVVTNDSSRDSVFIGPWGSPFSSGWTYRPSRPIKKIIIMSGSWIDHIRFENVDGEPSMRFGGNGGVDNEPVVLDTPREHITGLSGTFGPNPEPNGPIFINSLALRTNIRTYGPFGVPGRHAFSIPVESGSIVGFHGTASIYLHSIGLIAERTPI